MIARLKRSPSSQERPQIGKERSLAQRFHSQFPLDRFAIARERLRHARERLPKPNYPPENAPNLSPLGPCRHPEPA